MRWERLFADLEGELAAGFDAELDAEVAERFRHETGQQALTDRLRAAVGAVVAIGLPGGDTVRGHVRDVGPDWLLVEDLGGEVLLARSALRWVEQLPGQVAPPVRPGVWELLDLRRALRELVRQRAVVRLGLCDGEQCTGTLDRVYADHVDLARHAPDEPRRSVAVTAVRSVPLDGLATVRRLG